MAVCLHVLYQSIIVDEVGFISLVFLFLSKFDTENDYIDKNDLIH